MNKLLIGLSMLCGSSLAYGQLSKKAEKIYEAMKEGGLPANYDRLEIESKWNIDREQYRNLLRSFEHGQQFMGHGVNVRWGGVPKVFIDVYYDTPDGALAKKGQVLRFRKRVTLPMPDQLPDGYFSKNYQFTGSQGDIKKLVGSQARGLWIPEWGRVQFKEAAELRGAAWFRYEVGDSIIWSNQDYDPKVFDNSEVIADRIIRGEQKHEAIDQLLQHHDRSILKKLVPMSRVTDIRYRVEFLEGKRSAYEVSLDRLETQHLNGPNKGKFELGYESELEILPVEEKNTGTTSKGITPELIDQLYKFSAAMQHEFKMEPSTASKGGVTAALGGCPETEAATVANMY